MISLALLLLVIAMVGAVILSGKSAGAGSAADQPESRRSPLRMPGCGFAALMLIVVALVIGLGPGPMGPSIRYSPETGAMQATRVIALAMSQYAQDHKGAYPDGASSTEVFQQLLDGNYLSDPTIFYQPLPGKCAPEKGAKLKPENVGYDVTSGIEPNSPGPLPVVFLTGFRVDYRPGASTVSLVRPFPRTDYRFSDLFSHHGMHACQFDGIAVAYKNNNAYFRQSYLAGRPTQYTPDGYGIVPEVVAPDFDSSSQNYRQLTPDGVLKCGPMFVANHSIFRGITRSDAFPEKLPYSGPSRSNTLHMGVSGDGLSTHCAVKIAEYFLPEM